MRSVVYIGRDASTGLSHYGVKGQKWYHRYYQSYKTRGTRSGKVGTEHLKKSFTGNSKVRAALQIGKTATDTISNVTGLAGNIATGNLIGAAMSLNGLKDAAMDYKRFYKYFTGKEEAKALMNRKIESREFSTGFGLKKRDFSDEEDAKICNPERYNFDKDTKNNCVYCSLTMELRKRGYDVSANKNEHGMSSSRVKRWFPEAEPKKIFDDSDSKLSKVKEYTIGNKENAKKIESRLKSEPEGSRGILFCSYTGKYAGHAIFYEVTSKGVKLIDGQTGKVFSENKALSNNTINHSSAAGFMRLDNIEFDKRTIKEVAH